MLQENDYFRHAKKANKLMEKNDLESAIFEYELAFRIGRHIKEGLDERHKFWFVLKNLWNASVLFEERAVELRSRPYHKAMKFLRNFEFLGIKDKGIDNHFIRLIANSYLLFDYDAAFEYAKKYMEESSERKMEQRVLGALLFDALAKEDLADKLFLSIYNELRQDPASKYETMPTIKGNVYSMGPSEILRSIFLFKESSSYESLAFEPFCSNKLREALAVHGQVFSVSEIRHPMYDGKSTYVSVIKRERCKTLMEGTGSLEMNIRNAAKCLAAIHANVELPGMEYIGIDERISRLNYDDDVKNMLMENMFPLKDSFLTVPHAFHKDAHPKNFGVRDDGCIVVFDCENKGLRPVTEDLTKLLVLSGIDESSIASCIKAYEERYNISAPLRYREVHGLDFPFLNSVLWLAFSYPSSLPDSFGRKKDISRELALNGVGAIRSMKLRYNDYYMKHKKHYDALGSLISSLF
ncbi:hypothetical protein J4231_00455 [Candidatus Woesearchaeota archaeon]|nr:hypothetical protein [Candidatus Woesearchaeota archaeon]